MSNKPAATEDNTKPYSTKPPHVADMLVLDTTATAAHPKRTHELVIDGIAKAFVFEHGKPNALPPAIALKFLRWPAFRHVDDAGNLIEFKATPKQPEDLGAGEQLKLSDDETVARYDELSAKALQLRVIPLPGGEKFATGSPTREAMIAFLLENRKARAKVNKAAPDVGDDAFVPEAETEEAA